MYIPMNVKQRKPPTKSRKTTEKSDINENDQSSANYYTQISALFEENEGVKSVKQLLEEYPYVKTEEGVKRYIF
jgi:hypothetical protein